MAKPISTGSGTVEIPEAALTAWVATFLPTGQFYALGKVKLQQGVLKVDYNFSSDATPQPPA